MAVLVKIDPRYNTIFRPQRNVDGNPTFWDGSGRCILASASNLFAQPSAVAMFWY
jgi:hypothetical protein